VNRFSSLEGAATAVSSGAASLGFGPSIMADTAILAWKPFLQPAPGIERWWWLLILPTALGISLAYKSTRTTDLAYFPREATRMTLQVIGGVVGIAVFLYILVVLLLPHLPAE